MFIPTNTKTFVPYASRQQMAFVGDSLSVGNQSVNTGGYRAFLLKNIAANFYNDFYPNVLGADYANSYSYPCIGASGITSTQLLGTYVTPELATVPSATMPAAPDVVFLLIGTNDFLTGAAKSTWLANVTSIINAFVAAKASAHIFVGNLIDRDTYTATVTDWNASLAAQLAARGDYGTTTGHVHPVDLYTAVGPWSAGTYADQTHPNTTTYKNGMATAWYNAYDLIF